MKGAKIKSSARQPSHGSLSHSGAIFVACLPNRFLLFTLTPVIYKDVLAIIFASDIQDVVTGRSSRGRVIAYE